MSTLVVEIFDRHLGDIKFQFGETIIQMKPIHVCLILGLRVSPIVNEFLFVDPEHMTNFRMRRFSKKKNTYGLKEINDALKQAKLERYQEDALRLILLKIILSFLLLNKGRNVWVKYVDLRHQIEAPAIGAALAIGVPTVVVPAIGSSSSATEIGVVVVRYQFSTLKKIVKCKRKGGNEKEDGKRKKTEPRTKKGKGEWQKKAKEADVSNKKKKVEDPKKEALTDKQFDHVPLIHLKALIPKIHKKDLDNRVPRKRRVKFPELQNIQSIVENFLYSRSGCHLDELVLMESEVDATLKKRHALTEEEINKRAVKMDCEMNRLHAHLDELLLGVLLESFIQRPISQDEKNQVDQVWSLRKDGLSSKAKKDNSSTYMRIGEETVYLSVLCTLYPNQWLDNEVIDVYIKALIQYFDTQNRARPDNERIVLADIFACQYIGKAFNVWTRNMSSPEGVELKKKSIWEQIISMQWDRTFSNCIHRGDLKV
ncbi:hypothetical protein GIB67_034339, partial [Kingdonia uniflora]